MFDKLKKLFSKGSQTEAAKSPSVDNSVEEPTVSSHGYELATEKNRTCPYCGGHKDKLELLCYYHEGDILWSDSRHELPQQAVPSLVQQCPHCGKYYISKAGGVLIKNTADFEFIDPVTWDYFKQSYWEFCKLEKDNIVDFNHRFRIWGSFNDEFRRPQNAPQPSEEDFAIFKDNALHLIEMQSPIIQAELYREIGMFDECLALLDSIQTEDEGAKGFMDAIANFANQKEVRPFGWEIND